MFSINDPVLEGRPNGPGASIDPASTAYSTWRLEAQAGLALALDKDGVKPAAANWATQFDYATDQAFRLVEQPGAGFTMRRPKQMMLQRAGPQETVTRTEVIQIRDATGKDYLAVSTLCATLSYLAVRYFQGSEGETFVGQKDIEFRLRLLDANTGALESYAKGVAPGDVRIEWTNDATSGAALDSFIADNIKDGNPNPDRVLFPFHDALSVLFKEKQPDGTFKNGFEIASERKTTSDPTAVANSLFAMDFSDSKDLDLAWPTIAGDDTALWPTLLRVVPVPEAKLSGRTHSSSIEEDLRVLTMLASRTKSEPLGANPALRVGTCSTSIADYHHLTGIIIHRSCCQAYLGGKICRAEQ
jgi:hypothetical protein